MAYSVRNNTSRELLVNLVGGNTLRLPPKQTNKDQIVLQEEYDESPHLHSLKKMGYVVVSAVPQHETAPKAPPKEKPKASSASKTKEEDK